MIAYSHAPDTVTPRKPEEHMLTKCEEQAWEEALDVTRHE